MSVIRLCLSLFRRDVLDRRRKGSMFLRINGPISDRGSGRIAAEEIVPFPVSRRSYRPRAESASTVRANVLQHLIDTVRAECTFETTNARVQGIRRQCLVAVLAGGAKFKHADGRSLNSVVTPTFYWRSPQFIPRPRDGRTLRRTGYFWRHCFAALDKPGYRKAEPGLGANLWGAFFHDKRGR